MSNFATSPRFSFAGFALAVAMTLVLNGSMLVGFDRMAHNAQPADLTTAATRMAKTAPVLPAVQLERVVVVSRRA